MLARNRGKAFTREQLTEAIWGSEFVGEMTVITVLVYRLRSKIGEDSSNPRYIKTVKHGGYVFGG